MRDSFLPESLRPSSHLPSHVIVHPLHDERPLRARPLPVAAAAAAAVAALAVAAPLAVAALPVVVIAPEKKNLSVLGIT